MANNLTTIIATILFATLVILVGKQSLLGNVPRVKFLDLRRTPFTFYIFVKRSRLGRNFKVCCAILKLPPWTPTVEIAFVTIPTKDAVVAMVAITKLTATNLLKGWR